MQKLLITIATNAVSARSLIYNEQEHSDKNYLNKYDLERKMNI